VHSLLARGRGVDFDVPARGIVEQCVKRFMDTRPQAGETDGVRSFGHDRPAPAEDNQMSNKERNTSRAEDKEGHAIRTNTIGEPITEEDTDGHVQFRRISDAGTDDDTEGNRLK
jgi:hypothetical protein